MKPLLEVSAPAKLNLFLQITGQRDDGYHDLQTLFQLVDYGDSLTFEQSGSEIALTPSIPGVPDQENLIVRAAELLKSHTGCTRGARIHLKKRLPMGGGLGGGSSNAASTLLALNTLWGTGLSLAKLAEIGLELGADVPVFVYGRSSLAEGVGERLFPVELEQSHYLVLKPPIEVSTPRIFQHPRLTRDSLPIRIAAFFRQVEINPDAAPFADVNQPPSRGPAGASDELKRWQDTIGNDCEPVVSALYPEIEDCLRWLSGHAKARLTGTGSCIFARFESRKTAEETLEQRPAGVQGFVSSGCNISTAHQDIARWLA